MTHIHPTRPRALRLILALLLLAATPAAAQVSGGKVTLDDREPHTWSYYSDASLPTQLRSLNPADVTITYHGLGSNTVTAASATEAVDNPTSFSRNSTGVKVNYDADDSVFIYHKTLERTSGSEYGSATYAYTTIPNPFQVRPTGNSGSVTVTPDTRTVYISWSSTYWTRNANQATVRFSYTDADGVVQTSGNYTSNGNTTIQAKVGTKITVYSKSCRNGYTNYSPTITARYDDVSVAQIVTYQNTSTNENYQTSTNNITSASSTFTASKYRGFYKWRIKSITGGSIKSADGSVTYTQYSGSGAVASTNMLDAEETYHFIPSAATGMSVELEALWAQAYVVECSTNNGLSTAIASNNLNENISYERNFVVVTSGVQNNEYTNDNQKPVTISALYPDGTGTKSSSNYIIGQFIANADTKFENIYMTNASRTIYAYNRQMQVYYYGSWQNINSADNGTIYEDSQIYGTGSQRVEIGNVLLTNGQSYPGAYYYTYQGTSTTTDCKLTANSSTTYTNKLIVGRGVSPVNTYCTNLIQGISNSYTNSLNYQIRVESGVFQYFSFINGYQDESGTSIQKSLTCSGTNNHITSVLGCDYDRASGNNNNLELTGTAMMGAAVYFSNQDVTKQTLNLTIKSGKYFTSMGNDMASADANKSFYLAIANSSGSKAGHRQVRLEGGQLTNIAGGVDAGNQNSDADISALTFRMTGGTVKGAIYGGGAVSPASGNRHMIFTGGTVNGWIGAGCNGVIGTGSTPGGQTYGKSFVYVGGNTSVGGSATINGADGGNVFGAGKGSGSSDANEAESGEMSYGSTVAIADNADILNNVFGGGYFGYAKNNTNIQILGGTVHGKVFGGSNLNNGPQVSISMTGGTVIGGVYGGSNASGTVAGPVNVTISGGTVGESGIDPETSEVGHVFGSGYGAGTSVTGNVVVTIGDATGSHKDSPLIHGNVYGGGHAAPYTSTGKTFQVIGQNGLVKGSIFGGGKGSTAVVTGPTDVRLKGHIVVESNVFGGGHAATVTGDTHVTMSDD